MRKKAAKVPPGHTLRKSELCHRCGIARSTLDRILEERGFPKAHPTRGWNIESVINFIRKYAAENNKRTGADLANIDLVELRKRQLQVRVEKDEFSMKLARNQYVDKATAQATMATNLAETQAVFQRVFEQELPPELVGLNAPEIRAKLRAGYINALTELHAKSEKPTEV
jgi:predicted DNA-binding transcriptional regulator AlpA